VPRLQRAQVAVDSQDNLWVLTAESQEVGGGLAASPYALCAFFLGWVAIGAYAAYGLVRRGHDRGTMVALGAGLGPLMLIVMSRALVRREAEARPLVLAPGVDHGGDLDIMVLVQDQPEHVESVMATVDAMASEIGTLTLARAVDYEWLGDDLDNNAVARATQALYEARDLVPARGAGLVVHPGTVEAAARRFATRPHRTLVLVAVGDSSALAGPR
jgi:hypothetical protein